MEGDRIAVATSNHEEFDSILEIFGHKITPYPDHPKVLIFGATQAGIEISSKFLATGSSVTIIERDLQATTWQEQNLRVIHDLKSFTEITWTNLY